MHHKNGAECDCGVTPGAVCCQFCAGRTCSPVLSQESASELMYCFSPFGPGTAEAIMSQYSVMARIASTLSEKPPFAGPNRSNRPHP